jgi:hypothetical protein
LAGLQTVPVLWDIQGPGKAALAGVFTASMGYGVGLFIGGGVSNTKLDGFRIDQCGDGLLYNR